MSDDFTANATNPDREAEDAAAQPIHERLLTLGTQWRSQRVPTERLAAHIGALATHDHRTMPLHGYPLQQEEFVLMDSPPLPQWRSAAPRHYIIAAVAAVVVIALLGAAFLVTIRKAPGSHLPAATLTLPSATTAFIKATDLPLTATVALPVNSHPLRLLHMIDATTGWAQTDQKILRTTDGGVHWRNVTPPGITPPLSAPQKLIYTALAATTAWASDGKTIFRTTDAGKTWQSAAPPVEKSIDSLTFIDAMHGWAVDFLGIAASHSALNLWRTSDGGSSWTLATTTGTVDSPDRLPFTGNKSAPVFINATTGWFGGIEPVNNFIYFYVTHDGGVTWHQQALPHPPLQNFQMATGGPSFFNSQDGVLPVSVSLPPAYSSGGDYNYVTHDGGASWNIVAGTVPNNFGGQYFLDASHWWAFDSQNGNDLAYTRDAGQHWTTITPGDVFNQVGYLDFISPTTGWAGTGLVGVPPATLLHTSDGGHTWQQIDYQVD